MLHQIRVDFPAAERLIGLDIIRELHDFNGIALLFHVRLNRLLDHIPIRTGRNPDLDILLRRLRRTAVRLFSAASCKQQRQHRYGQSKNQPFLHVVHGIHSSSSIYLD
ncbi:hypothetical protein D3C71_1839600 [compost metagenome]